jgi:hypothetical protein
MRMFLGLQQYPIDNPPSLASITSYGAIGSNPLLGYNLATSFGPLTASPGGVRYPTGLRN